jgi:hypothetical protein
VSEHTRHDYRVSRSRWLIPQQIRFYQLNRRSGCHFRPRALDHYWRNIDECQPVAKRSELQRQASIAAPEINDMTVV